MPLDQTPPPHETADVVPVTETPLSPGDGGDGGEGRMGLGDHLAELRSRLILCVIAVGAVFMAGLAIYPYLWDGARVPIRLAAQWAGADATKFVRFQGLSPLDGFLMVVRVDVLATLILTMPLLIYQAWSFVAPGLTRRERRAMIWIFSAGSGLFLAGVAVAFFLAVPLGLRFLVAFNQTLEGFDDRWTGRDYLGFLTMACLGFGVCFETPLVMMALARVGLIRPEGILRYWRHAVLVMVFLGAIFTPPDPFTQILLAGIMILLFFLGYFLARWTVRAHEAEMDLDDEA